MCRGIVAVLFAVVVATVVSGEELGVHHTIRFGLLTRGWQMDFSPNEKTLYAAIGGNVNVFDVGSGERKGRRHITVKAKGLRCSRDGTRVLFVQRGDGRILYDTVAERGLRISKPDPPKGWIGLGLKMKEEQLIVSKVVDGSPAQEAKLQVDDIVLGIADGRHGTLKASTGLDLVGAHKRMMGTAGTYLRLRGLPKGNSNDEEADVRVLQRAEATVRNGRTLVFDKAKMAENAKDNLVLGTSTAKRHTVYDAKTGVATWEIEYSQLSSWSAAAVSPDSTKVAAIGTRVDGKGIAIEVVDVRSWKTISFIPCEPKTYYEIRFDGTGKNLLVATEDTIEVANVAEGGFVGCLTLAGSDASRPTKKTGDSRLARAFDVSPKGILATIAHEGEVSLWDLRSGKKLVAIPSNELSHLGTAIAGRNVMVKFSSKGNTLAFYTSPFLHIVDVSRIQPLPETEPRSGFTEYTKTESSNN